jgi:hypothetical protein
VSHAPPLPQASPITIAHLAALVGSARSARYARATTRREFDKRPLDRQSPVGEHPISGPRLCSLAGGVEPAPIGGAGPWGADDCGRPVCPASRRRRCGQSSARDGEPDSGDDAVSAEQPAHIIGTLDAIEEGAVVVVAGLRLALAPGVSVPSNVPIGANVTVTVGELNGVTVASSVRPNLDGQRV